MQPSVKIPVSVDAEFAPRKFALGCGFPLSQMVWGICIYTPTAKWNIHGAVMELSRRPTARPLGAASE